MLALARGSGRRGICCCPPTGCQRVPPSLSLTREPRAASFFFLSFFLFKHVRADEGKAKAAQKPKAGRARFPPGAASWQAPPTIPHAGHQRGRDGRGRWSRRTASERAGKAGRFWPFVVEPDPPQNSAPVCVWWWSSQAAISRSATAQLCYTFFFLRLPCRQGLPPYPTLPQDNN